MFRCALISALRFVSHGKSRISNPLSPYTAWQDAPSFWDNAFSSHVSHNTPLDREVPQW